MSRRLAALCSFFLLVGEAASAADWWSPDLAPPEEPTPTDLPVPPFPPRITEGRTYDTCLSSLTEDPAGAVIVAEAWQATGGGEGAAHCQGLALIAVGRPEDGAVVLEQLASLSNAAALARASVLSQAVQARLMVGQAAQADADATKALDLSPVDIELRIMRAAAEATLGRFQDAIRDLNEALRLDQARTDALVPRAGLWRKLGRLDLAQADVTRALALNPDDADALLERGIVRERMGDRAGARADWEHARSMDPDSTTADLVEQNLSLLEAGPEQQ